ncbi:MAG: hypothetical protein MJ119_04510 [Lachnospiraceae bacterium]|nr:hypothetical protein [Lachnospiraceae bacterium]
MYRQKSNSFIIYIVIAVLIAVIVLSVILFNGNTTYPDVVTTDAQFEQMVYECASHYKTKIKFKTSLDLRNYDFDILFRKIMDTDTYIGCELYRYAYHYTFGSDGLMNVELRIDKPSRYRVFMTKLRVKQIAGHLRNLDTYDQVKAVHDYLVSTNEYNMTFDTAYNCLYVNKSACNGYAYSFYAIMEELGVPATVEYGGKHAWNSVQIDGEWYNLDCTWDDNGGIKYDYFLKSNDDFKDHEHVSGTAAESFDMAKAGPSDYYHRIPPYRELTIIFAFCIPVISYFVIKIIRVMKRRKERKELFG